jgi:3-phosphoglycerate kinase
LEKILKKKVEKLNEATGNDIRVFIDNLKAGDIVMLENLRFYSGEEKNTSEFAKQLAQLGDIYVNEAFAVSHRKHASIVGINKYLPSVAGLIFKKEIEELNKILKKTKHHLVSVIGGAKIETKIKVIEKFLKKADRVLIGGALPNTIFAAKGIEVGKSFIEKDMFKIVKKLDLENSRLRLPSDFVTWSQMDSEKAKIRGVNAIKENESVFDIGPKTIGLFLESIEKAKMVIWNGPLGKIEQKPFDRGSEIIAKAIAKSKAYSIVGGGDTVAFIQRLGLEKKINHISTGGGAMLEYLANETLPGIEALKK